MGATHPVTAELANTAFSGERNKPVQQWFKEKQMKAKVRAYRDSEPHFGGLLA